MKSKFVTFLLSFIIAFGLWTYVVNNVSREETLPLYNVPVIFQNEGALTQRSLMLTEGIGQTVTLNITGNRAELYKLSSGNVSVVVDLSRIYDPGAQTAQFTVHYPSGVDSSSFEYTADKSRIALTVENVVNKRIPVKVDLGDTSPAEGYSIFPETEYLSSEYIRVEGPASVVEQMTQAVIQVDLTGSDQSIRNQVCTYVLCDSEGNPVEVPNVEFVKTDVAEVEYSLTIQRRLTLSLSVNLLSGAGATQETTTCLIDPLTIEVTGTDESLDRLDESLILNLGDIDLAEYTEDTTLTLPINMPAGVTNLNEEVTEATVYLSFPDIATRTFIITNIQNTNVPAGMVPELVTKQVSVTVRGPKVLVDKMTESDLTVSVSFGSLEIGVPKTVTPEVRLNPNYPGVTILSHGNVTIVMNELVPETTGEEQP